MFPLVILVLSFAVKKCSRWKCRWKCWKKRGSLIADRLKVIFGQCTLWPQVLWHSYDLKRSAFDDRFSRDHWRQMLWAVVLVVISWLSKIDLCLKMPLAFVMPSASTHVRTRRQPCIEPPKTFNFIKNEISTLILFFFISQSRFWNTTFTIKEKLTSEQM